MTDLLDVYTFNSPIQHQVTQGHVISTGTIILTKRDLEAASCPACYRPLPPTGNHHKASGYCARCQEIGADVRHQANRRREEVAA